MKTSEKFSLHQGRMISGSKSRYSRNYPFRVPVYNANIVAGQSKEKLEKIWYGDLDLSLDVPEIMKIAKDYKYVYVLYESDARFETEQSPRVNNSLLSIENGEIKVKEEYYELRGLRVLPKNLKENMYEKNKGYFHDVSDLYQSKGKEGLKINLPEDLKKNLSFDDLNNFLTDYLLSNFDRVKNDEITFYHKEVRFFALEDYLTEMKASELFAFSILNLFKGKEDIKCKDFILHLYENKDVKTNGKFEYNTLLRKCLHMDFFYVAFNLDDAKNFFNETRNKSLKTKKLGVFASELRQLDKVSKKHKLHSNMELLSLFVKTDEDFYQIKKIQDKLKAQELINQCFVEYFKLNQKDSSIDENFSALIEVKKFFDDVDQEALEVSVSKDLKPGEIMIPYTEGIIF